MYRSKGLSFLAAVLIAVAAASAAEPAGTISGRILDPQGTGVPGAVVTIYLRGTSQRVGATSDERGGFRFERLAPAEYLLEARAAGFAPAPARAVSLERGASAAVDVTLEVAGVRELVVGTASGTAQAPDEVSKSVTVVSEREIEARDELAISEALRLAPGLRVQQLGGPGAFTSIKTRGLRNEDTAVLIDGLRFREVGAPQGDASGFLGDLVVTDVDRLEVLRGSGSSLYGSNAIGGVINLVTDEGGGRTHGSVLAEGGSLGLSRARARLSGGFGADRLAYSAGFVRLDVRDGIDGADEAHNTSGQGRVAFRLAPSTTISGRIYTAKSLTQLNTSPQAIGTIPATGVVPAVPLPLSELRRYESGTPVSQLAVGSATFIPSANNPDWTRNPHFFSGALTLASRPSPDFGYSVSYQALDTFRAFIDGPLGVSFQPLRETRTDSSGRIYDVDARADARLGRFQLVNAGYEFESETYRNASFPDNPSANSSVDVTERSHALFAQDQLRFLGDRLQLSASFRVQHFTLRRPAFAPVASSPYSGMRFQAPPNAYTGDGSIAYFLRTSGTKLRAHVGNGYRAPSLYERFGTAFSSFGYSTYGDPRLRPDRSIAVDAGIDQTLARNRVRASATWFYTRLQEIIIFDFSGVISPSTDPFGRFGGYRNTGGGLARGLELSASGALGRHLDLAGAYTYTNADQRRPLVSGILQSFVVPEHQFSLVATGRIGARLMLTLDLSTSSRYLAPIFDSRTFVSRAYEFDGIVKADLVASYRIPISDVRGVRIYGKVENMLDREYYENGFRTPGATALGGLKFEF
jgi:iron complex outermembrane receptor protein